MEYTHARVTDATYRIRKMRGRELYSVTEYYKGDRVMLADNNMSLNDAHILAARLSNRTEF